MSPPFLVRRPSTVLSLVFSTKSAAMLFGEHMADVFGIGITILDCPFGAPENRNYTVEVDCSNEHEARHYRDTAIALGNAVVLAAEVVS